jgi:uncharacterized Zn-binding protein involved in type VI secretion
MWISQATLPDVCKTPTPGGPVPMPYPNIAQSSMLSNGTTTIKADGMMAAIKGSEFSISNGDQPGTVGGVKSNVFMKEATWLTYSFDVKLDGKNACRLTDKMFHNHENTVDAQGTRGKRKKTKDLKLKCAENGPYKELQKKTAKGKLARDHVPAKRTLFERALTHLKGDISKKALTALKGAISANAWTIAIPTPVHINASETYGQSIADAQADGAKESDLQKIAKRDIDKIQPALTDPECAELYRQATEEALKRTDEDYNNWLKGIVDGLKKQGFKLLWVD